MLNLDIIGSFPLSELGVKCREQNFKGENDLTGSSHYKICSGQFWSHRCQSGNVSAVAPA